MPPLSRWGVLSLCLALWTLPAYAAPAPSCPGPATLPKDIACSRLSDGVLKFQRPSPQTALPSFFAQLIDLFRVTVSTRPFDRSIAFIAGVGSYTNYESLRWVASDLVEVRNGIVYRG